MERIKRKREEEEQQKLAEVLVDYEKSFDDTRPTKVSFVRSESSHRSRHDSNSHSSSSNSHHHHHSRFREASPPAVVFEEAIKRVSETAQKLRKPESSATSSHQSSSSSSHNNHSSSISSSSRPPKPGRPQAKPRTSQLDSLKEEFKSIQEMRRERLDVREREFEQSGLRDDEARRIKATIYNPYLDDNYSEFSDNLSTTNLHVSYLPTSTTEEDLYQTFGSFGPLASVKIRYPKSNGEHRSQYLFAFVAFMSRKDAERAQAVMQSAEFNGSDIRVNWGKVIEMPPVPIYVPPALREMLTPVITPLPFNAKPRPEDLKAFTEKHGPPPNYRKRMPDDPEFVEDYQKMLRNAVVHVLIPTERELRFRIHRVIEYVVREGPAFEAEIVHREMHNPQYAFLSSIQLHVHAYYRWRMYSILQGDDLNNWRTDRFRMYSEGSWWQPPPIKPELQMPPSLYKTAYVPLKREDRGLRKRRMLDDAERERREYEEQKTKRRRGALTEEDREFLEEILRNLTPKRRHVGLAMCWCLRRARSAKEIVECIVEALMVPEAPLYKKLGRFYLLSDILANCEIQGPDIANFRQYIETKLEAIFVEFNKICGLIPTRINQSQFRNRVCSCIQLWSDNTIYPKQSLMHYQNVFYGIQDDVEVNRKHSQYDDLSEDDSEDDRRSNERRDRRSDSPRSSERRQQQAAAFKSKEQDDWVTVDPEKEKTQAPTTAVNRWEKEDYGTSTSRRTGFQVDSSPSYSSRSRPSQPQPVAKKSGFGGIEIKLGGASTGLVKAGNKSTDEKRKILRQIEERVVLFQDELEEKNRNDPFMQEKVDEYRDDLLRQADLTSFAESCDQTAALANRHRDDSPPSSRRGPGRDSHSRSYSSSRRSSSSYRR